MNWTHTKDKAEIFFDQVKKEFSELDEDFFGLDVIDKAAGKFRITIESENVLRLLHQKQGEMFGKQYQVDHYPPYKHSGPNRLHLYYIWFSV